MSASIRFFRFSRVVAAAAVAGSLCCAGPGSAWAGSAGDFPTLRSALAGFCFAVGMTSCPQPSSATGIILEMSGLMNSPPDDIRNIYLPNPCGNLSNAGDPCPKVAVNAVNAPVKSPPEGPLAISYLTPLAFKPPTGAICTGTISSTTLNVSSCASGTLQVQDVISGAGISQPAYITDIGTCASPPGSCTLNAAQTVTVPETITVQRGPTQYGDPAAKRFLYAALIEGADGQPQVLDLVLDDTSDTRKQFSKGPVIAFSLPLVMLQNKRETPIPATLLLTATCNGAANCLTGTVTGISGKTLSAAQLGIQFDSSFGTSPNSATPHRQYELVIPILATDVATPVNDSAYFPSNPLALPCPNGNGGNPLSGYCNAFSKPVLGFSAPVLSGASVGIAPYAAPLCPDNICPATPPTTTFFGFCASFPNPPPATTFSPVAATFLQIGTNGTTSLSTPVSTQGIQCPPVN